MCINDCILSHALINTIENIKKVLDDENICCGVFANIQKMFDTIDDQILRPNNGIRGVSNDWFKSYLSNRNHYVSINGYNSSFVTINCGVSERSTLGPLLFLLYINDLNQAIKFCKLHLFAPF